MKLDLVLLIGAVMLAQNPGVFGLFRPKACIKPGTELNQYTATTHYDVSREECCRKCYQDPQCRAFDFVHPATCRAKCDIKSTFRPSMELENPEHTAGYFPLSSNDETCPAETIEMDCGHLEDQNQCILCPGLCPNGECLNNPFGLHFCRCNLGYTPKLGPNKEFTCQDIDECENHNRCINAVCINTCGSFECVCNPGYHKVNGRCIDVNECGRQGICTRGRCTNLQGSHTCSCPEVTTRDDPCVDSPCGAGTCVTTSTGYYCDCDPGYEFDTSAPTPTCVDVDECTLGFDQCEHSCTDGTSPVGGYTCDCNPGYDLVNGVHCQDVDECTTPNICGAAPCVNTPGSFVCICVPNLSPFCSGALISLVELPSCTITGDTSGLSPVTGSGFCGTSIDPNTNADLAMLVYASCDTDITYTTCHPTSNYDTKISIFNGCGFSRSTGGSVCIGGNDNDACAFGGTKSRFTHTGIARTIYAAVVHGATSTTGTYGLSVTCADPSACICYQHRCYNNPIPTCAFN